MHVMHLNSVLTSAAEHSTVDIDLTLNSSVWNLGDEEIIGQKDLQDILESLLQQNYLTDYPQTPLYKTLANFSNIESKNELFEVL